MPALHHRPQFGYAIFAALIGGLVFAIQDGASYWWLLAYLVHFVIFSFGIGFGLHRSVGHKIEGVPIVLRKIAASVGVLGQVGSPLGWRTTHVLHHGHTDEDGDPHSPGHLGWRVILGATELPSKEFVIESALRDPFLRDPYFIFLHRNYYFFSACYVLMCGLAFGIRGAVYLAVIPIGLSMLGIGCINYFAHVGGEPRNLWWLWPFTFGENWHGNHHQSPNASEVRNEFYQIDLIELFYIRPLRRIIPVPRK